MLLWFLLGVGLGIGLSCLGFYLFLIEFNNRQKDKNTLRNKKDKVK